MMETVEEPYYDYRAKVVVVGETGVGKTSLLLAYCGMQGSAADGPSSSSSESPIVKSPSAGALSEKLLTPEPTIGVEFHTCVVNDARYNKKVKLNFWYDFSLCSFSVLLLLLLLLLLFPFQIFLTHSLSLSLSSLLFFF